MLATVIPALLKEELRSLYEIISKSNSTHTLPAHVMCSAILLVCKSDTSITNSAVPPDKWQYLLVMAFDRSPFSWYLAVPRPVLADHINLVVAVGKQNDHSGITGTVKNKTDCISGGHSRHLGCVITCDYNCQSYRASICVGGYAAGNIVTDIQAEFQVTIFVRIRKCTERILKLKIMDRKVFYLYKNP